MHEYFIHLYMNICEKMSVCLQVCLFFTISTSFYFVYFFRQTLLPDQFTLYRTFMAKKNIISSSTIYQQYIVVAINIICSLWRSLSLLLLISLLHFQHLQVVLIWFIVKKCCVFQFSKGSIVCCHIFIHILLYTHICMYVLISEINLISLF